MHTRQDVRRTIVLWSSVVCLLVLTTRDSHAAGYWENYPIDLQNAWSTTGNTSIDVDVGNQSHISYYDSHNGNLMYWGPDGLEIVDSAGDVGWSNSLHVRGYQVSIAYYDGTNNRLKFAVRNGSSWDIEVVDTGAGLYCSLNVIDALNRPAIAYYKSGSFDLRYAVKVSGAWQIQTVDSSGNVGHFPSLRHLRHTPYHPRIAYTVMKGVEPGQIENDHDLKFASWNGASWEIETVVTDYVSGKYASLTLNSSSGSDYPAIAYYRTYMSPSGQVRHLVYARKRVGGGQPPWEITTVDGSVGTQYGAGEYCSMTEGPAPNYYPQISYIRYGAGCCIPDNSMLYHAEWTGSDWIQTRISTDHGEGWFTSITMDSDGNPRISHLDPNMVWGQSGVVGVVQEARWVECLAPAVPSLSSPANGATCTATTPMLSWQETSGATSYEVQIGSTCGSGTVYTTTQTQYAPAALNPGQTYTWRVRGKNPCDEYGTWSACSSFTVAPPVPGVASLASPPDAATGVETTVLLDWGTVTWATNYQVQIGTVCGTGPISTTANTEQLVSALEAAETYFWRVRAENSCGSWGGWSSCYQFATVNTPAGQNVVVEPAPGVTVEFGEITSAGDTNVETSSENPGPDNPGYMFMGTYYDITTTATYSGEIEICLAYDDAGMSFADELGLRLFHLEGAVWIDITTSIDTVNNIICGTVTSLSAFGVAAFQPWVADGRSPIMEDTSDGIGVSWVDYDMDGDDDLYVSNHMQADRLFRNDGGGVFVNVAVAPLGHTGQGSTPCWGDYDNDGDPDLYLTVRGGANVLYRNDGGVFVDVTAAPMDDPGESQGAAWADYDNDGDLDIYVANYYEANRLYRNDGDGVFVDATNGPLGNTGQSAGVAWADYDGDGDVDLYVANTGTEPNKLFRNDGGGAFTDVTTPALADTGEGRGVAWGDYDNDADLDLYLANGDGANKLFRNDGGGVFVDVSGGLLADAGSGRGVAWADYDNDGDLDLYVANLNGPNKLIRNEGGGAFADGTMAPLDDGGYGVGVAWADYDGDGDLDLYLANVFGPNHLFRNDQIGANHWLHVNLMGVLSNRSGVGARIRLVAGGQAQIREVTAGSGYLSQNSITAEFGLGATATVDTLVVRWPSGIVNRYTEGIGIDRVLTVGESQGDAVGVDDRPIVPDVTMLHAPSPNPFNPRTTIQFDLAHAGPVRLRIYDTAGRLVRSVVDGVRYEPGIYMEIWNGTDRHGRSVASGVYHVRLETVDGVQTKTVTLVR